jgi:cell division septum initiation protein DivIVA
MEVIKLLEYLQELLETSSKIPMTNKVVVKYDEFDEVLDKIINYLPDEFKKAQWICEEKERILKEASEHAESMKSESMDIIRKRINNHDYVKEAHIKAEEIVSSAQRNAKTIKYGARDYANEVVSGLQKEINVREIAMLNTIKKEFEEFIAVIEKDIEDTNKTINYNIEELRKMK